MRAHRVEVAQGRDLPARVGRGEVVEHLLSHELGPTVRVHGAERGGLGQGLDLGRLVHRRAAAVDDAPAAMALHGLAHAHQAADVVRVVVERPGGRFADGLEGREVDHGVDGLGPENTVQRGRVTHVGANEARHAARELGETAHDVGRAVGQVVEADDVESRLEQGKPGVRADVAGGAGEQDGGHAAAREVP